MPRAFSPSDLLPPESDLLSAWIDRAILWMIDMPRRKAWAWTIITIAVLAVGDYVTGTKLWFGSLYLLAICLTAGSLGARAGLLVGLVTVIISYAANGASFFEAGSAGVWNVAMRLLSVVIVVALVGGFRRSIGRERLQARTDSLTGALTRQAFLDSIAKLAAERGRDPGCAILAYIDLDEFKQVNDLHGHAAGDAVLQGFAQGVRATLLPKDRFARVGGDEFLLFLPLQATPTAEQVTTLLHGRLSAIVAALPHAVTCSIGALLIDGGKALVTHDDIERADRLMYEVKRFGGNAMRIAVDDVPVSPSAASGAARSARANAADEQAA